MNVWLSEIWRSWRASLRSPGFLLLAVGILGLGVGASTTVFTLVDHVLLRPLPFSQPGRLVAMGMDNMDGGQPVASPQQYQHLKSLQGVVSSGLVTQSAHVVNVLVNGAPQQARALTADSDLLPALGVHLLIGHNFTVAEDRPHGPPVVILSHGFWERAYGGKSSVLGRSLLVKGVSHTIIGVLPASFDVFCGQFLHTCDIMLPLALAPDTTDGSGMYLAVARMAPGTTLDAVRTQVNARMQRLVATNTSLQDTRFKVMGLDAALHADRKPVLNLFVGTALFVLLIACVNLTNLMFLRTLSRSRDDAIRTALGASALRSKLPVLAESLLVGVCGALAGVGLAAVGLAVFKHFMPASWLGGGGLHVGTMTWVFAVVVGVCAALAMTLLGLWRARRFDLNMELREGGRSGASTQIGNASRMLVIAQVALATALLCGSGLFTRALVHASQVPLGFKPDGVVTFNLLPLGTTYPDAKSALALAARIRQRFNAEPGVIDAAVSTSLPTSGYAQACGFRVGRAASFCTKIAGVSPGYFRAIGVPVIKGRAFTHRDLRDGPRVVIVNQAFARAHFDGHALGKMLHTRGSHPASMRIVGVVGDTRHAGPLRAAPAFLYRPLSQLPSYWLSFGLVVALHVRGNAVVDRSAVHAVMGELAPMQPIAGFQSLAHIVKRSTSDVRLDLLLVGTCAVLALLLATAGIYAVMAVAVASREHEFGVRTALGASPTRLVRLVLRSGMWQIGIGLVVGIGMAVLLSFVMHTVLARIGHHALDPIVLGSVCVLLVVSGLLACLRPALRAGHVAPMRALRGE